MKKSLISMVNVLYVFVLLGCGSVPESTSIYYIDGAFGPIVKEDNSSDLYITWSKEAKVYRVLQDKTVASDFYFEDIAIIRGKQLLSQWSYYLNIENEFYQRYQLKSGREINDFIIRDSKKLYTDDLIAEYYNNKIDLKKILRDAKLNRGGKISIQSPLSLYPEGVYFVYYTDENVTSEALKNASVIQPPASGYHAAYYRFFPADDPDHYKDVKIPYSKDLILFKY